MTKDKMINKFIDEVHKNGFKCIILIEEGEGCVTHVCKGINSLAILSIIKHKQDQDDDHRRKELLN